MKEFPEGFPELTRKDAEKVSRWYQDVLYKERLAKSLELAERQKAEQQKDRLYVDMFKECPFCGSGLIGNEYDNNLPRLVDDVGRVDEYDNEISEFIFLWGWICETCNREWFVTRKESPSWQ